MICSVLKKGLNNGKGVTAMGSKKEETNVKQMSNKCQTNVKDVVEIISSTKTELNKERTVQAQKTRA